MAKFVHKPIIVEAVLCSEVVAGLVPSWLHDKFFSLGGGVVLDDREMFVPPDYWIVWTNGLVHPVKPEEFAETYDQLAEDPYKNGPGIMAYNEISYYTGMKAT